MYTGNPKSAPKIGVLALQGAFIEHVHMLKRLGIEAQQVRLPQDLTELDGLIIPGGESTTIGKLATNWGLIEPLREMAHDPRKVVWGTCAGMILLAQDIGGLSQPLIGVMDIKVKRNAFGSQLDSFEADMKVPAFEEIGQDPLDPEPRPFHGVFIRAPHIQEVGSAAQELAHLEGEEAARVQPQQNGRGQEIVVAARQDNLLATSFHPELTDDTRFHELFLKMVDQRR